MSMADCASAIETARGHAHTQSGVDRASEIGRARGPANLPRAEAAPTLRATIFVASSRGFARGRCRTNGCDRAARWHYPFARRRKVPVALS